MTAKEYLKQALTLENRINSNTAIINDLKLKAKTIQAVSYSAVKVQQGHKNTMEELLSKIDTMEEALTEDLEKSISVKAKILEAVNQIEDLNQQAVLKYRYICGYDWNVIADKMNYSYRSVHRYHSLALKSFEKVIS